MKTLILLHPEPQKSAILIITHMTELFFDPKSPKIEFFNFYRCEKMTGCPHLYPYDQNNKGLLEITQEINQNLKQQILELKSDSELLCENFNPASQTNFETATPKQVEKLVESKAMHEDIIQKQ